MATVRRPYPSPPSPYSQETVGCTTKDDPTVTVIDPNGDVVLELADEANQATVQLLVSSKVLSLASPVFATMFRSRFREGLSQPGRPGGNAAISPDWLPHDVKPEVATRKMAKVALPEDDVEAVTLLCKITHYRMHDVPETLDAACLKNIAVVCDKYDCGGALRHSGIVWLQAGLEDSTAHDLPRLLFAAYVLDIPAAFARISWDLVTAQVGPFTHLPDLEEPGLVTQDLIGHLEARKAELLLDVVKAVEAPISESLFKCSAAAAGIVAYIQEVSRNGLWPSPADLQRMCVAHFIANMLIVEEPPRRVCDTRGCLYCRGGNGNGNGSGNGGSSGKYSFSGELLAARDRILRHRVGLCLDCVKTGRQSLRDKTCRVKH